jgi:repressor LexA
MKRLYAPNRIRELRKLRGLTQENIASGISPDTTKGTVAKLETRQMALSADYILAISNILGVSPGEVLVQRSEMRDVPVLSCSAAANWREAVREASERIAVPDGLGGSNLFALRVEGDSIDLVVPDGGIVVVDPEALDLQDGRIFVVSNGDCEAKIKRFNAVPPRLDPCSTNPVHLPIEIGHEPFVTIGRAVFALFKL